MATERGRLSENKHVPFVGEKLIGRFVLVAYDHRTTLENESVFDLFEGPNEIDNGVDVACLSRSIDPALVVML